MLSASRRLYLTISSILFVTLISYLALDRGEGNVIQFISGLLLSWFIPGFALMAVLYPDKLKRLETLILSVVISFIFDVLVGTILEFLNFKLNESGFVFGLWLITISLLCISYFKNVLGTDSTDQISLNTIYQSLLDKIKKMIFSSKLDKGNFFVFIVLMNILLFTVSWAFVVNLDAAKIEPKPFTALTIEPSSDVLSNRNFKVVIDNKENNIMVYRLELRRNSISFAEWKNITLDQNGQWVLELPSSQFVGQSDLWLFRQGEDQPYRYVHLFVH